MQGTPLVLGCPLIHVLQNTYLYSGVCWVCVLKKCIVLNKC